MSTLASPEPAADPSIGVIPSLTDALVSDPPGSLDPARVLHVINGEHYSGAERVQDLLAQELPCLGYEVGFACLKNGLFSAKRGSTDAPVYQLQMRRRWDLLAALRLARLAHDEGYQLLHAHTPRSLMVAYLAKRLSGLPLVYHVHSPAGRDSTRWFANRINAQAERVFAQHAERLITVSPSLTDHMRLMGFKPEKLRCVPNGVAALPADSPAARQRRQPVEPFVVGMVALFRPRKGTELLLDAIARLRDRGVDVRLEAFGPFETPEYESRLMARVKRLALQEQVHWAGFTDDMPGALARIDALVLPSLFGEGMPMVVLEAMAAGLPVIATRCEGTVDAVADEQTGFLIEPGSVTQIVDAIERLFSGGVDYPEMSRLARERHAERFSAGAMARATAGVYAEALAKVPARR